MKRLNPKTNAPFKYGDIREDGYVFTSYSNRVNQNGFYVEQWVNHSSYEKQKLNKKLNYQKTKQEVLEKNKTYYLKNKEIICERKKVYKQNNRARYNALNVEREKAKNYRTPKWLTIEQREQIVSFYKHAKEMQKVTGVLHHVDHIVPLCGKTVSGLHVPWNLKVITAKDNLIKYNKFVLE